MSDLERFQQLKEKVDSYNASIIEKEIKQKNAQEELNKLLEDLKTMGYSSVEEAQTEYNKLEEEISKQLNEMEQKLNAI